jgi:hypothetical protein
MPGRWRMVRLVQGGKDLLRRWRRLLLGRRIGRIGVRGHGLMSASCCLCPLGQIGCRSMNAAIHGTVKAIRPCSGA